MSAPATTRPDKKEFRRIRKDEPREKAAAGAENEVKVTSNGRQSSTITYIIALFNGEEGKAKQDTVKITGMGAAIYNAVNVAEIVKRRVKGLHQTTEISSQVVHDSYEAIESGKEGLEIDRKVSMITVVLSTKQLDKKNIGYQPPLPEDQVTEQEDRKPGETIRRPEGDREGGRGRGRGRGRGGRGGRGSGEAREERGDGERGGRGSGRGRGDGERGGRGADRGRGDGERGGRGSGRGRGDGERGGRGSGERRDDRRDDRRGDAAPRGGRGAGERGGRGSGERGGRGSGERGGRGTGERGSGERGARGSARGRN